MINEFIVLRIFKVVVVVVHLAPVWWQLTHLHYWLANLVEKLVEILLHGHQPDLGISLKTFW